MRTNKKTSALGVTALMGCILIPGGAQAVAIVPIGYPDRIMDTFSRDDNFHSSFADSGQAWNASSWSTNGSVLEVSGTGTANIGSGFLEPERTYTLEMDVTFGLSSVRTGPQSLLAFGFTTAPSLFATSSGILGGVSWSTSSGISLFGGDPLVSQLASSVLSQSSHVFEMVLTTGTDTSDANLFWRVDGARVGNSIQVDASRVNGVFIESDNAVARFDNLRLAESDAIPEPSSFLLLTLSGVGLMLRRRR